MNQAFWPSEAAGQAVASQATVETLNTIHEMHEVERLQGAIWKSDPDWVVPSHLLYIIASSGGIVLGARIDGELVGFVFGILARRDSSLIHASHMLGILDRYRSHGIGYALKERQRLRALEQGITTMTWTFDPLEARNAHFNLRKLGARSTIYRTDYYGEMRDAINQGLPSDRLLAEWDLDSNRGGRDVTEVVKPLLQPNPISVETDLSPLDDRMPVSIPIPQDIQTLRLRDPQIARQWQLAARKCFVTAFERGYVAAGFQDGGHILFPPLPSMS